MFQCLSVQELFPTPLWVIDLEDGAGQKLNRDLLDKVHSLTEPRAPVKIGGSWQTDPILHQRPEFGDFLAVIIKTAKGALEFLDVEYRDFVITGCWANINPPGGKNSSHTHPNNYISGVYYVSVPEGSGAIEFLDPRAQAGTILPKTKKWNKFNGTKVTIPAKEGRLVLFPAWLSHSVPVNVSDGERVSISFNIMFTDYTESMSATLWEKGSTPIRKKTAAPDP
jgi:uncharacterized protein (TIGR02466 family)